MIMLNLLGEEIYSILPMRYPYMILDYLQVEEGKWAKSSIELKEDAWFFQCHFPGNPIFPGFLLLESMGQTLLSTFIKKAELKEGQVPLMAEVKDIHFDSFCIPGDKIIIHAELGRFKYGIARGGVVAYKNEVSESNILAGMKLGFILSETL